VARLALPRLFLFGLIVNPDTGAVLRDGRGMLEELSGPPFASAPLREELILDEPVLKSVVHRLKLLGYADNTEFDVMWSDMQKLLTPTELMAELVTTAEGVAKVHGLAGRALASSLMQVLQTPRAGDPLSACRFHARVRDIPFLHTRAGKKLVNLRQHLDEAKGKVMGHVGGDGTKPYSTNIERADRRQASAGHYGYGQLSVAMMHKFKIPLELEAQSQRSIALGAVDVGFPAAKLHSNLEQLTSGMASVFSDPGAVLLTVLNRSLCSLSLGCCWTPRLLLA
jgi:hypothetical protein